jgi:hypothetical protein
MKKVSILFLVMLLSMTTILVSFAKPGEGDITGRWETKPSANGNITGAVFRSDNSFEGYINKKPFVSGTYTVTDNVLSFVDNGCEGMQGVYRLVFFSNADSLSFEPIVDNCTDRRNGMSRLVVGRIK